MADESGFDAIVLAGGRGERMGIGARADPARGVDHEQNLDKVLLHVGDLSLLDHAVLAVAAAATTVVVGPRRPSHRPTSQRHSFEAGSDAELIWTREHPPGSGPASAIVHALTLVRRPVVVVVAGDMPFAATAIIRLLEAVSGHDAAMLIDEDGRRQPLIAAYVTDTLRARGTSRNWAEQSVRALVEGLDIAEVSARDDEALDCDTPADLARARAVAATRSDRGD
ncbi:MAG: molybdenum cofactor guanylyltransferase [Acidothermaceae bacterium]